MRINLRQIFFVIFVICVWLALIMQLGLYPNWDEFMTGLLTDTIPFGTTPSVKLGNFCGLLLRGMVIVLIIIGLVGGPIIGFLYLGDKK